MAVKALIWLLAREAQWWAWVSRHRWAPRWTARAASRALIRRAVYSSRATRARTISLYAVDIEHIGQLLRSGRTEQAAARLEAMGRCAGERGPRWARPV